MFDLLLDFSCRMRFDEELATCMLAQILRRRRGGFF